MNESNKAGLDQILKDAKALSSIDRAYLIEQIFETFDSSNQSSKIDESWALESEDRLKSFQDGELKAEDIEEVLGRINNLQRP